MDYALLDSGNGRKFEKFGAVKIVRPCSQAIWKPSLPEREWERAHAVFFRDSKGKWSGRDKIPNKWHVTIGGVCFVLKATDFGHLGIFPEQAAQWEWIREQCRQRKRPRILNLFAYSGGATLAAAQGGAEVWHIDAAKGMIEWGRENAQLNHLENAPIHWIVEDVRKYLTRAVNKKTHFDGILLDPPTFGRGKSGEVFKAERDIPKILDQCRELLSDTPLFFLLSSHTPGFTPLVLEQLLKERFSGEGNIGSGEMVLKGKFKVPSGAFARWNC